MLAVDAKRRVIILFYFILFNEEVVFWLNFTFIILQ